MEKSERICQIIFITPGRRRSNQEGDNMENDKTSFKNK
jgi:hypothetical protein